MLAPANNNEDTADRGKRQQDISLLGEIVDILDDVKPASPTDTLEAPASLSRRTSSAGTAVVVKKEKTSKKVSKKVKQAIVDSLPEPELKALMDRLCLNENGFDLINERIKLSLNNTKEAALFIRKRATVEEEYAAKILKIVNSSVRPEQDKGTFTDGYRSFLAIHSQLAETRLSNAHSFIVLSEDLNTLYKNTDKSRRQLKEAASRHWKYVGEVEAQLDKAKLKYEQCSEEWEKAVRAKDNHNIAKDNAGGKSPPTKRPSVTSVMHILGGKAGSNTQKLLRAEEDYRLKSFSSNEAYKQQLARTNAVRREFFSRHLPQFIKSLKDTNDECEVGLKFHLIRYSREIENAIMQEATTVSPLEQNTGNGLVSSLEKVNPSIDFLAFTDKFLATDPATRPYDKSDIKYKEYTSNILPRPTGGASASVSPVGSSSRSTPPPNINRHSDPSPYFGVDLAGQLERDDREVPLVVERCIAYIEKNDGLGTSGIYRVPGATTQVSLLRREFVMGEQTDLGAVTRDPHDVTSLLKLFFRQLPEPLFTHALYPRFLAASKQEEGDDDRVRVIAIHELVNLLPDANYATLRALMRHLYTVVEHEGETLMNAVNLGIVWGPTLLEGSGNGLPVSSADVNAGAMEFKHQARVVECVLANFEGIFEM